ncbi:hypothetical protein BD410DRAFT_796884 [Rickenella mellea]|uniref:VHS domain-containing protein n=1 Tax=Rickenella mellea TaxID=50990 RepID=A0A4Y7PHK0_9AGAM|nr:hypothetical protein BD410DRAFT_796884 [Rickenella mellea]
MRKLFGAGKPKATRSPPHSAQAPAPGQDVRSRKVSSSASLADSQDSVSRSSPDGHARQPRAQPVSPTHQRERTRELERSDVDSRPPRPSTDEPWEVIEPPIDSPVDRDALGPPNPHIPLIAPSRSSSLAFLPPGASPPAPAPPRSSSPYDPTVVNNPIAPQEPPSISHPNTLRKKPKDVGPGVAGVTGAATILRGLDPNKRLHSDLLAVQGKNRSVESFQDVSGHSDLDRTSRDFDREREWRERDRDIEARDKGRHRWHGRDRPDERRRDQDGSRERDRSRDRDGERKEDKKSQWTFFSSGKDKERDKEREEIQAEQLTRMIGYITATSTEDWPLVLEVCERASVSEANAKIAAKAIRREFKYAEPPAQLSAARLWAIMLQNSSEIFIAQTASRKFLDTLEDVISSPRTSPVVRERLLDILAAAAYASSPKDSKDGFRALWRKLKQEGKPDEGYPFDKDDTMLNPTTAPHAAITDTHADDVEGQVAPRTPPPVTQLHARLKQSTRNQIVPLEEDIKRLFEECKIGKGNASLLNQALAFARPEDLLEKVVIKEFYRKCLASQELIYAQIPWASSRAERSREQAQATITPKGKVNGNNEWTRDENLLAELLKANEELTDALRVYDDLERLGVEKEVQRATEERSRHEVRLNRSVIQSMAADGELHPEYISNRDIGSSRSPSPSPQFLTATTLPPQPIPQPTPIYPESRPASQLHIDPSMNTSQGQLVHSNLIPPLRIPHGPRPPAPHSRSPSPTQSPPSSKPHSRTHSRTNSLGAIAGSAVPIMTRAHLEQVNSALSNEFPDDSNTLVAGKPSAKALGKRRVVDDELPDEQFDPDDIFYTDGTHRNHPNGKHNIIEESDVILDELGQHPTHYVYDAAAERTQEWIREERHDALVNGVH